MNSDLCHDDVLFYPPIVTSWPLTTWEFRVAGFRILELMQRVWVTAYKIGVELRRSMIVPNHHLLKIMSLRREETSEEKWIVVSCVLEYRRKVSGRCEMLLREIKEQRKCFEFDYWKVLRHPVQLAFKNVRH